MRRLLLGDRELARPAVVVPGVERDKLTQAHVARQEDFDGRTVEGVRMREHTVHVLDLKRGPGFRNVLSAPSTSTVQAGR